MSYLLATLATRQRASPAERQSPEISSIINKSLSVAMRVLFARYARNSSAGFARRKAKPLYIIYHLAGFARQVRASPALTPIKLRQNSDNRTET